MFVFFNQGAVVQNPFSTFLIVYHILLGDFGSFDDKMDKLKSNISSSESSILVIMKVFFCVITFILMIVMLNILIAFVLESYNKSIAKKESAYFEQLAEIIN